jgi:hypothetical protein
MNVRWCVVAAFACAGNTATVSNGQTGAASTGQSPSASRPPVDPCAATELTCRIEGARVVCYAPSAAVTLRMFVKRPEQKNELVVLDRDGCTFTAAAPTDAMVVAISAYGAGNSVLGMWRRPN